jgi:hypothetical protein
MDADDDVDDVAGLCWVEASAPTGGAAHNAHSVLENAAGDDGAEGIGRWRRVSHSAHRPDCYW